MLGACWKEEEEGYNPERRRRRRERMARKKRSWNNFPGISFRRMSPYTSLRFVFGGLTESRCLPLLLLRFLLLKVLISWRLSSHALSPIFSFPQRVSLYYSMTAKPSTVALLPLSPPRADAGHASSRIGEPSAKTVPNPR